MQSVKIGGLDVSRLVLGSNMFSGFSHVSPDKDREMIRYYTCARIKEALRRAESLGVNTIIARGDHHMLRVMLEYWDEGGALKWFGQTCPELGTPEKVLATVAAYGAPACHIHGGQADHMVLNEQYDKLAAAVDFARRQGLVVGLAGHMTQTIRWVEDNLDVDYYMCSYYNTIPRDLEAAHRAGIEEVYLDEDRQAMTDLIQTLERPVIHYKVMAAGRNDPEEAFDFAASRMRPGDACCVGVYTKDNSDMLAQDARLLDAALVRHGH